MLQPDSKFYTTDDDNIQVTLPPYILCQNADSIGGCVPGDLAIAAFLPGSCPLRRVFYGSTPYKLMDPSCAPRDLVDYFLTHVRTSYGNMDIYPSVHVPNCLTLHAIVLCR